jgi:hypothetical protein
MLQSKALQSSRKIFCWSRCRERGKIGWCAEIGRLTDQGEARGVSEILVLESKEAGEAEGDVDDAYGKGAVDSDLEGSLQLHMVQDQKWHDEDCDELAWDDCHVLLPLHDGKTLTHDVAAKVQRPADQEVYNDQVGVAGHLGVQGPLPC